jgi:Na+/melibiose symporter-like transporter
VFPVDGIMYKRSQQIGYFMSDLVRDRLSPIMKLAYGAGDFGFSFTDTALGVLFAIFLVDVAGLVPRMATLAVFIGKPWDYINDPIVG